MNRRSYILLLFILLSLCPFTTHGQWIQTIRDTSVSALVVTGTDILAGTCLEPIRVSGCDVYLSSNNGSSWTLVNISLGGINVNAFAISGTHLYAGTQGHTFNGDVLLSTNNGTSWAPTFLSRDVYALAVSGTNLFAGTHAGDGGVFLSTNAGTSWTVANNGLSNTGVYAFAINGTNVFAGTGGGGIYLSTNSGTSWAPVNSGLTNTSIVALAASGNNLFAGTWGGGVFISTNSGTTWNPVNNGLTNTNVFALAVRAGNVFAGTLWWRCLSLNQQRRKLERREHWLHQCKCVNPCRQQYLSVRGHLWWWGLAKVTVGVGLCG